ncbi:MAG TPA: helix-turn-helix transcriptional regulator [Pseudonocardiaceae bacterium]|jgi:transcriptional regulator with XRE-family HTH domain|nr:helix-turn-helix transcriptional regulator [Pseudonocardiaceae bacterium]
MTTTEARPTPANAVTRRRRSELGDFLKASRGRLSPEEVGLPPGVRRRTAGLRREEVALLAGVGITWYTWLEQGRPINASWQVLDAIAHTLRMDATQRWHLYRLAEATPVRWSVDPTAVPETVRTVLRSLDPLPATLINCRFDVIAKNGAYTDLFAGWHTDPCVHSNTLWCCLTEPAARDRLANYDDEIAYLVARLRADYGQHVGDPDWEEDIRRLSEVSTEFAELWARQEVAAPAVRVRRLHMPDTAPMTFEITELAVSPVPGLRMQIYTPCDEATTESLAARRK